LIEALDLADPLPNAGRAVELRRSLDSRMLKSLRNLLGSLQHSTNLEVTSSLDSADVAQKAVEAHGARLPATVYAMHWNLLSAIKRKEWDALPELIESLAQPFDLISETRFDRFPTKACEARPLNYLHDLLIRNHQEEYGIEIALGEVPESEFSLSADVYASVLKKIAAEDPDTVGEFSSLISEVRLIKAPNLNAGSSFPMYGCIYLHALQETDPWTIYLEHLVHECAHHFLFAVWTFDPIILDSSEKRFNSPLRKEPRPLSAIYHQMFVLARVIRMWSIFQASGKYGDDLYRPYTNYQNDKDGANFVEKFWISADTLAEHAEFSDLGRQIFESCCSEVRRRPVVFHA
jgi:hypothetical protein